MGVLAEVLCYSHALLTLEPTNSCTLGLLAEPGTHDGSIWLYTQMGCLGQHTQELAGL